MYRVSRQPDFSIVLFVKLRSKIVTHNNFFITIIYKNETSLDIK